MFGLIEKYRSISFIGMSKNAGKTTTLNFFINETRGKFTLGLSSIGRDGELTDRVTGTAKPQIYIYKGTIITTAAACMKLSDATLEILRVTDITTPMGNVVITRAVTDGYVEIAGPSTNHQTSRVIQEMYEFGADKVFIDGALSRKSLASPAVAEATVMSTGAAISSSYGKVVEETLHSYQLLTIDTYFDEEMREKLQRGDSSIVLTDEDGEVIFQDTKTLIGNEKAIAELVDERTRIIYTGGAVTDAFVDMLLRNAKPKVRPTLIVSDGTKLFVSPANISRMQAKGIKVYSLNAINIIAMTINPYSANDYMMSSKRLIEDLQKQIRIPVFDVMDKGSYREISG